MHQYMLCTWRGKPCTHTLIKPHAYNVSMIHNYFINFMHVIQTCKHPHASRKYLLPLRSLRVVTLPPGWSLPTPELQPFVRATLPPSLWFIGCSYMHCRTQNPMHTYINILVYTLYNCQRTKTSHRAYTRTHTPEHINIPRDTFTCARTHITFL